MAHDLGELRQKQSLPLKAKIIMTLNRIRDWYEFCDGEAYVSFSGGKDSTVLLHLVRSLYPDVPAVFCDTGLEYPEIRAFVNTVPNVVTIRPEMGFKDVIEKYGYPVVSKNVAHTIHSAQNGNDCALKRVEGLNRDGSPSDYKASHFRKWAFLKDAPFKINDYCCTVMKKRPLHFYEKKMGGAPYIGTMADESNQRTRAWLKTGCNVYEDSHKKSAPLSFWLEQDVLQYIVENNLPIASVYGEVKVDEKGKYYTTGVSRTGCMFCAFGAHLEKSPNRFEKMKETHPKQYDFCMRPVEENGLGFDKVLTYMNIKH